MENSRKKFKRSEAKECWDGRKYTKSDLRMAAKPEKDRKRDRMLLIFMGTIALLLTVFGGNEVREISGKYILYITLLASLYV